MANLKFSQFQLRTDQAQVEALVGYDGLDNIQIDPNLVGTKYDLSGTETDTNEFTITLTGSDSTSDNVVLIGEAGIAISQGTGSEVNISRTQGALLSVVGVWKNLFGGDPGIFGDTLEFAASASPVAANSSVFQMPFDGKLIKAQMKWIHETTVNIPLANSTWDVNVYSMTDNTLSTTQTSSYQFKAALPTLSLAASDTGTFPTKTWDGNVSLSAGEIINISGVENGEIGTDDAEMELCLIFEIDL
tara:strand:- start:10381 stop:11118 length:738 start_codon:yes stop_codon:yes gene_type:complete